jgi:hypothetical protein
VQGGTMNHDTRTAPPQELPLWQNARRTDPDTSKAAAASLGDMDTLFAACSKPTGTPQTASRTRRRRRVRDHLRPVPQAVQRPPQGREDHPHRRSQDRVKRTGAEGVRRVLTLQTAYRCR